MIGPGFAAAAAARDFLILLAISAGLALVGVALGVGAYILMAVVLG